MLNLTQVNFTCKQFVQQANRPHFSHSTLQSQAFALVMPREYHCFGTKDGKLGRIAKFAECLDARGKHGQ